MNYLFLITGILIGLFIGLIIGMLTVAWGISNGYLKDYYYIPYKLCDKDLYAIKDGKLERKSLPEKIPQTLIEQVESDNLITNACRYKGWNDCIDEILGEEE